VRGAFRFSFNPWGPLTAFGIGPAGRFFELGEARLAVLYLLAEGPKHGYQLIKELQDRSGGLYRASTGTVYPTLQELDDEGLISSQREEGKRVYQITDAGREELKRNPEAVDRIWQRAERWEDWGNCVRPESFVVLGSAKTVLKAAFYAAARAGGRPEREQRIRDILERTLRELTDLEKSWREKR
jgi:DNA-binding PadR family transcriptional regulator